MTDREVLRVGLLGAGAVAQVAHLPILAERTDARVVALADPDPGKTATLRERFAVDRVMSDDELLEADGVDAVVVCTPNHLHERQALAALAAGKHVLVERPLAVTADGVRRVLEAAGEADRSVMVGMSHRYRPDVLALHSFVAGGQLGRVYSVRGTLLKREVALARATWRHRREEAGGGALMDLGVQMMDLCLWVLGYPEVKRVSAVTLSGDYEVEDAAVVIAETDSGIALQMDVSWSLFADGDRYSARVLGRQGSGWLPPLRVFRQVGGRPIDVTPDQPSGKENPYTTSYRRMLDRFVRVASGVHGAELPWEQAQLMAVVEAAYRSATEGRDVALR